MKIGQYCQRQRCKQDESEQFWHAFASRGFVSDSWAFLFYITLHYFQPKLTTIVNFVSAFWFRDWIEVMFCACMFASALFNEGSYTNSRKGQPRSNPRYPSPLQCWKTSFQSGSFARWNHSYSWPQKYFRRTTDGDTSPGFKPCRPASIWWCPGRSTIVSWGHLRLTYCNLAARRFSCHAPHRLEQSSLICMHCWQFHYRPTFRSQLKTYMLARQFCSRFAVRSSDTLTRLLCVIKSLPIQLLTFQTI